MNNENKIRIILITSAALLISVSSLVFATPPKSSKKAPYFDEDSVSTKNEVVAVVAGNRAQIKCKARGEPEPSVRWYRGNTLLSNTSKRYFGEKYVFQHWSLLLYDTLPYDSDYYTCIAFNRFGNISRKVRLQVNERMRSRPIFVEEPKNVTSFVGEKVEFVCKAISDLHAAIEWWFKPDILPENSSLYPTFAGNNGDIWMDVRSDVVPKEYQRMHPAFRPQGPLFVILNVTEDRAGLYKCVVGSGLGTVESRSAHLTVFPNRLEPSEKILPNVGFSNNTFFWTRLYTNATSVLQQKTTDMTLGEKIFVGLGVVFVVAIFACAIIWLKKKLKKQPVRVFGDIEDYVMPLPKAFSSLSEKVSLFEACPRLPQLFSSASFIQRFPKLKLNFDDLTLDDEVKGFGVGGFVVHGVLRSRNSLARTVASGSAYQTLDVAVKRINEASVCKLETSYKMFFDEMDLLATVGRHENVVKLMGLCENGNKLYMVLEYCAKGDLKSFLHKYLEDSVESDKALASASAENDQTIDLLSEKMPKSVITTKNLVNFALQVAKGMKHIIGKNCIHGDLAARNVMLTADNVCKVGDFGLAKELHDKDYYWFKDCCLPIKWMAPEALLTTKLTAQNDIWAFGVCLWEIFTFGDDPYRGFTVTGPRDMAYYLETGRRLPKPNGCPDIVYDLMKSCWSPDPADRPTFYEIICTLTQCAGSYLDYLEVIVEEEIDKH